jgi:hypothetical protein
MKWVSIVQDGKEIDAARVDIASLEKENGYICDFKKVVMKEPAFKKLLFEYGTKLRICIQSGAELQELEPRNEVSMLKDFGDQNSPIQIILPSIEGKFLPAVCLSEHLHGPLQF